MDPRVSEFQCIMPLDNIPSVLKHCILPNERAAKLPHHAVAMQEVQDRRDEGNSSSSNDNSNSEHHHKDGDDHNNDSDNNNYDYSAAAVTASARAPAAL